MNLNINFYFVHGELEMGVESSYVYVRIYVVVTQWTDAKDFL